MRNLAPTKSKGLSLVELMVALLLGSIITVAATQLFLLNQQTNNLQNGLAYVQDQGRFAFSYISRDLMQAGFNHDGDPLNPFVFVNTSVPDGSVSSNNSVNGADVLVLQVSGGIDCLGNEFTGQKEYQVNTTKGLLCRTRAYDQATDSYIVNSETVVDGVEAFEVLYGVDTDDLGNPGYGSADFFLAADDVTLVDRIVSVRYALLLSSDRVVSSDTAYAPTSIQVLDQEYDQDDIALADGKAYRVYTSTVGIRNQI